MRTPEEQRAKKIEWQRAWIAANPNYHANYRAAHREERREYNARYVEEHRVEVQARLAEYRSTHREERSVYNAQWAKDNPTRANEKTARWRKAHPEAKRASEHRRRVRKRGGIVEDFLDIEIFERDNYICGICHKRINRQRRCPDPLSVTLDHIVAIANGGNHTRDNVQASHFGCNMSKGAR
jgi:hypothetical protein